MIRSFLKHNIVSLIIIFLACSLFLSETVSALTLVTRIADNSTEVSNGEKVYFDVEIKYPENTKRRDLRVEYQILEGEKIIASEKVLRAVETQASFLDYVTVPTDATEGTKTLNVIIETYESVDEGGFKNEVSATFRVRRGLSNILTYLGLIFMAIVFVVILIIIQIIQFKKILRIRYGAQMT